MTQTTLDEIAKIESIKDRMIAAKAVNDAVERLGYSMLVEFVTMPQPEDELPLVKRQFITAEAVIRIWEKNGFRWVDDLPF